MISRAALLALEAQLATTAAQIATMRAQIASWIELPIPAAPPSPRGAAEAGSGSPASAADGTPGASAKDRIAAAHNSEPGARLPPTEAPETRPPVERSPRPAGSSLRGRLLDFLALHAETGAVLPTDHEIGKQFGTTQEHVSVEFSRLKKREGIVFAGERHARIVEMPGIQARPRRPAADADRDAIERYIATKGVTKLPTAFADASTGSSTEAERAAIAKHCEEQDARRREEHQARLDRAQGRAPTLVKARA